MLDTTLEDDADTDGSRRRADILFGSAAVATLTTTTIMMMMTTFYTLPLRVDKNNTPACAICLRLICIPLAVHVSFMLPVSR